MGLTFRELRSTGPVNEQVRDGHDLSAPQLTHLAEVHDHQCLPLDEESER